MQVGNTGLLSGFYCLKSILGSGGDIMKIWEAGDTLANGGATSEIAQIIRVDALCSGFRGD
jgi:hypothetical protein